MNPAPRYDRIVSLVLLALLGLAVVFLIDINPNILRARFGGDFPSITVSWLLIASLVVIASAGADIFIRAHPQMQTRSLPTIHLGIVQVELAPSFWILPSFAIIASFAFFRLFSASLETLAFVLVLIAAGGFLFGTLVAQHYSLDRRANVRQGARLALQAMALLLAFGVFSAIYYARMRTLYSATLIGASATLLAYAMLSLTSGRHLFVLSLLVGLTLAEATWALNYWAASFLTGGALLLALFYIITGLLQGHLEGTLTRRVIWEYGALGSLMLLAVMYTTLR
ncbi:MULTISPECIES: hypothetical protein [Roseiflexus]|uniref:Uncharacterized protein n=1 Tax=Roseiflexus castenholzii (strain DSM 13941 / HLO8) TaxID=383372 RepID=A7NG42_ROSCS|nr:MULTISPECIES: hypothetical protein [Roseiflexus]ABU56429.1 conserved hypothetical protein [Roseiflexus castenholzii DSM 13941]PMP87645.1 MAG: hypothetical protein C0183_01930 [Roseiflexus castenholzii]GIV99437.1 MAG: hypothetical protein KatS3mg058_0841 [Roseiflexus sp.]